MRLTRTGLSAVFALVFVLVAGLAGCSARGGGHGAAAPHRPYGQAENALPGDPNWRITRRGADHEIEGYADQVSVLPGRSFRLFVSTTSTGFKVEAFRVGWYGGAQARLVWTSPRLPGHRQAPARVIAPTNTVVAPWKPSLTVSTKGWPPGAYLLRLDADSGAQRYVPLIVRSPSTAGKVVLLSGVTTWQAYNTWGGYSLYWGPGGKQDYADRARIVSFDRPYDRDGAPLFMSFERPAIVLAEKLGVPLAYETTIDVHRDAHLLDGARAAISLGHDEYWTTQMRAHVTGARDRGTNIAFLGANAVFRRIRLAPSALGPDREVVDYKDAAEDPLRGKDDSELTIDWREPPAAAPESTLTGTFYECNPVDGAYVVYRPDSWVFAGTGVHKGSAFPHLVGPEYDRVNPGAPTPHPIEVLAHSPVTCRGVHSYADSAYYTTPSGAGVFATGTMRWVCGIDASCGHGVTGRTAQFVSTVTANVLRVFAAGPAGRVHPAVDNMNGLHASPGDPIWAHHNLW